MRIISLFIALFLVSHCDKKPRFSPEFPDREIDFTRAFSWIQNGSVRRLESVSITNQGTRFAYYIDEKSDYIFPLTGSLLGVSDVLRMQLVNGLDLRFIEEELPDFVRSTYSGEPSWLLDTQYLELSEKAASVKRELDRFDETEEANLVRLRMLCKNPEGKLNNGYWNVKYLVMNRSGGVEQWTLKGDVSPATVDSIEIVALKNEKPLIWPLSAGGR